MVNRIPIVTGVLLSALLLPRSAVADGGDDFANNLFSDLAPLLALFGERVTMQFMSQSMGWADNIILAVAPIGIITAMVGAIRVGGPTWLKAIIGRAKENLAIAEGELMSSTSDEVCEVWNGREVVRCMGTAPVVEFICLIPGKAPLNDEKTSEIEVVSLREALEKGYLDEDGPEHIPHERNDSEPVRSDIEANRDLGSRQSRTVEESPQKICIIRNLSPGSPNISLNSHHQSRARELWLVASIGLVLQFGVLVYSGFATYHHSLKFLKDGGPIASYAYPCTAAGTLILVLGMMLCTHVVDSSTVERTFRATAGRRTRMVWLQQTKTVSDQVFKSCMVYAPDDRRSIITSRRPLPKDQSDSVPQKDIYSTDQSSHSMTTGKGNHPIDEDDPSRILQLKTIIGTSITLSGFVVQFIGLRGMHWSASIAQLGAVLMMVGLKAWVRRGLATPPVSEPFRPGFELDQFAKTLGRIHQEPWSGAKSNEQKPSSEWVLDTGGVTSLVYQDNESEVIRVHQEASREGAGSAEEALSPATNAELCRGERLRLDENATLTSNEILEVRKKLAQLADWRSPASAEAISLAMAIEVTMNSLDGSFPEDFSSKEFFLWHLQAHYAGSGSQPVHFQLQRQGGKWKAFADEIDAALSLLLSSVDEEMRHQDVQGKRTSESIQTSSTERKKEDDAWLRSKGSLPKQSLRLLGPLTPALLQDLQWWVPRDLLHVFKIRDEESGLLNMDEHRVVGYGRQEERRGEFRYERENLALAEENSGQGGSTVLLAAESYQPLKLLYAQDMYSAFMRAAAKKMERPVTGGAEEIRSNDATNNNSWQILP